MEKIETAALSKIADIISNSIIGPIIPEEDIWKKIFYNAEQGELFEEREPQFKIIIERYGWGRDERNLYFNDMTYNAIFESFKELEYRFDDLVKLLNCMAEKMVLYRVIESDIEELQREYPRIKNKGFEDFFFDITNDKKNMIINQYATKNFKLLKNNLNSLGLEIFWDEDRFCVVPFTRRSIESAVDLNVINQWLRSRYENVCDSYVAARKAFSNGDGVGCITHCRNVITGILSYKKDEGREWYNGLQKVCHKDKNILTLTNAKAIPNIKYDVHSADIKQRYKYPRFNLINKLYIFTCDLGAHINEGNVVDSSVDSEVATMEDALFALRMTEDMLIWLYQTGSLDR